MKTLLIIIIVSVIVFLCYPSYIKWHLGTFEQGAVYTLLNLIAPPQSYYQPVVDKTILTGKEEIIQLEHEFTGKYIIKVKGEKDLIYSGSLICKGEMIEFSNSNTLEYIESDKEHWVYLYSVPSQLPLKSKCTVSFKDNRNKKLDFSIVKFTHK